MLSRPRPAEPWRPAAGAKKVPKRYKGLRDVDPAYWDEITVWKSSGARREFSNFLCTKIENPVTP